VDHDGYITAQDLVAASRSTPANITKSNNAAGERAEAHTTLMLAESCTAPARPTDMLTQLCCLATVCYHMHVNTVQQA
jgi:hypothetical protein